MELVNLFKALYRKKWIVIFVTIVSVAAAAFFSLSVSDTYISTAQLATGITDEQTISLGDNASVNNFYSTENKFSNLIENIKSRQVISLLSYRLMLHDLESKEPFRPIDEDIRELYSPKMLEQAKIVYKNKLDSIKILSSSEDADLIFLDFLKAAKYDNKSLMEDLTIYRIPSTDYIKFEFHSENPKLSAFVVNTLCKEFIRYYITVRSERSSNSVEFLAQLADDKKQELNEKVNALKEFKSDHEVVNLDVQSQSIIDQIREMEVKREEERKKIIGLQQAIKKIEGQLTGRELNYLENQNSLINERILELKDKISALNNKIIANPNNPKLQEQLETLRDELQAQIRHSTANNALSPNVAKQELINNKINNEVELEIAKASVSSLGEEISRLKGNISGFASKEAQISALEREISVAQDAYLNLLDKLNSARLTSRNVGNALSQVELGYPADEPVKSKKLLMVALAGVISFSFSVLVIIGMEFLNRKPKTPFLLEEFTGLRAIGHLNVLKAKNLTLEALFNNSNTSDMSIFREGLRKIRHEVENTDGQVILFSSIKPGEGKSALMYALAYSLSLNAKKVLLIDTNFKNNGLTRLYAAKPALEKYLIGSQINPEQLVSGTGFKGIDVLGCEGGAYSPSEIFAQVDFKDLLKKLQEKYHYIFLEGAPLYKFSDTRELMKYADKIIPVFSAEAELENIHQPVIEYLKTLNTKMLGAVLNKVKPKDL